jgi:AraC-like DNA-binding protein
VGTDTDLRLDVPLALRPWVAEVLLPAAGAAGVPTVRLPDAATSLVFRTNAEGRSDLVVVGPQTKAGYFAGKSLPTCLRLRLQTARARRLLDAPPAVLLDRSALLTEFWGPAASRLAEDLGEVGPDPRLILTRIEAALLDRVGPPRRTDRSELTAAATRAIAGRTRLTSVARQIGVSERQLRNLFASEVGLSPKHYARIARLRRVLAGAGERGWAELAHDAGYYDQAHLNLDFGALMGVSPGAYLDGRLPSPSHC